MSQAEWLALMPVLIAFVPVVQVCCTAFLTRSSRRQAAEAMQDRAVVKDQQQRTEARVAGVQLKVNGQTDQLNERIEDLTKALQVAQAELGGRRMSEKG